MSNTPSVAEMLSHDHNVRPIRGRSLRVDPSLSCHRTVLEGSGERPMTEARLGGETVKGTTK